METQTITLELPILIVEQVRKAADILGKPVNELFAQTISSSLPHLDDVPAELQTDLTRMTWLPDAELWRIAHTLMTDEAQNELRDLSMKESLTTAEEQRLNELRNDYGRITLQKARAYALLSLRGGKPLLQ